MERQTVDQRCRAQVAALPVRSGPQGGEVLLITSRASRRWIIPKGWPMKGCEDHDAAAREAIEEAGVTGRINRRPIGTYVYQKRIGSRVGACRVSVYVLEVDRQLLTWRERGQRKRQWFDLAEAAGLVSEPALATLIVAFGRLRFAPDRERTFARTPASV